MPEKTDPALAAIRQLYFDECAELLSVAMAHLNNLQPAPAQLEAEEINAIFRAVHSVKGGAGTWGLSELAGFAHKYEALPDGVRNASIPLRRETLDILINAHDVLVNLLAAAETGVAVAEDQMSAVAEQLTLAVAAPKRSADPDITAAATFSLTANLDRGAATGLLDAGRAAFDAATDVEVDGGDVERITTPCIQVLLALAGDVEAGGRTFRLRDPSSVLRDGLSLLGFGDELKRWEVTS